MSVRIIEGDNLKVIVGLPDNSIDTIITDPPYGLGFMGKDWDTFKDAKQIYGDGHYTTKAADGSSVRHRKGFSSASSAGLYDHSRNHEFQQWFTVWAKEVLRIAKPGTIMLVFGGTRTFHRLTCAIEDAGWEIRDCMMWLYGSGFPKSLDISKAIDKAKGAERTIVGQNPNHRTLKPTNTMVGEPHSGNGSITIAATDLAKLWDGWGTALKPAWEPIIVAMKPLDGTFAHNAEKWGVGGLWIGGGRIGYQSEQDKASAIPQGRITTKDGKSGVGAVVGGVNNYEIDRETWIREKQKGRWPANLILDEEAGAILDEQSGISGSVKTTKRTTPANRKETYSGFDGCSGEVNAPNTYAGFGGASRFFYCAKASKKERDAGCRDLDERLVVRMTTQNGTSGIPSKAMEQFATISRNNHPTVKPLALMEYLCKLTKTPTGGTVLDPFGGSGTTALACQNTGRDCIIIEKEPEYCKIIKARTNSTTIEKPEAVIPEKKETSSLNTERRQNIIEEAYKKLQKEKI